MDKTHARKLAYQKTYEATDKGKATQRRYREKRARLLKLGRAAETIAVKS